MSKYEDLLRNAPRERLPLFLASSIHAFTIMARDPENSPTVNAAIINRIHRLAGHLMWLLDHGNALDVWRVRGIVEDLEHLVPSLRENATKRLRGEV